MKRTILALVVLTTLALTGSAATPNNKEKRPVGFEGKHPVFVVICSPVYCGGIWMDKKEAVRNGFPKCSAKITNFCYR